MWRTTISTWSAALIEEDRSDDLNELKNVIFDVVDKMLLKPRIDVDINSDHPARQLRPWSSWKEMNERSWGGMSKSHHNISWLDDKIVNVSNIKYNKIKYKSINYKSLSSNRYESFIESPTIDFL